MRKKSAFYSFFDDLQTISTGKCVKTCKTKTKVLLTSSSFYFCFVANIPPSTLQAPKSGTKTPFCPRLQNSFKWVQLNHFFFAFCFLHCVFRVCRYFAAVKMTFVAFFQTLGTGFRIPYHKIWCQPFYWGGPGWQKKKKDNNVPLFWRIRVFDVFWKSSNNR